MCDAVCECQLNTVYVAVCPPIPNAVSGAVSLCQNNPYLPEKNDNLKKVQNLVHYDKMNGFSRKNQNFIEGILQKCARWQEAWSKMHPIKKWTLL